jgi:hypothetical protein
MKEFDEQLQRGVLSSAENTLQSPESQSGLDLHGSPEVHLRPAVAPHGVASAAPAPAPLLLLLLLLVLAVAVVVPPDGKLLLLLLTRSAASTQVLPLGSGTCCFA